MIYLASPYAHPNDAVQEWRASMAARAAGILIARGHLVVSPIAHGHAIVREDTHRRISGERWYEYGFELLQRSEQLWILELEGWSESHGVQREIAIATSRGIPLKNIDPCSLGIDSMFAC
jgi:hypothetical protein